MNLENTLVVVEQDTFEQDLIDLSSLLSHGIYDDEAEQLYKSIKGKILSQLNFQEFSASKVLSDIRKIRCKNVKHSLIIEELVINPLVSYSVLRKSIWYVEAGYSSNFSSFIKSYRLDSKNGIHSQVHKWSWNFQ